ncbi:hypothetical protein [Clostridium sp. C2-6-12]|uniref:hypothetical protein n=1 Tax=Clostridium sp. C2-6-12 TaxID=2698832 RepID=UPI0013686A4E|nr:hypothetical protein [Clostridium sp. C2-6-12]
MEVNEIIEKAIEKYDKKKEKNQSEIIEKTAKETAKNTVMELKGNNLIKGELSYYKKVELLLYRYEILKDAIKQKEEDIEYIEKHGLPQASKSIVVYQTGRGSISAEDRYLQLKEKYLMEKMETERDMKRIENAISKIEKDKYFSIIQYRYLNKEEDRIASDEEVAEKLKKDRRTIGRNRARLMNDLITILFPESLREII